MKRVHLGAVVMAGGLGTRMRSTLAKHLYPLLGRRMIDWVLEAARPLQPDLLVVVVAPENAGAFDGLAIAVQERALGTGDAVRVARGALAEADEVLVLSGDTPLLTAAVLEELVAEHRTTGAAATVLSFRPADTRSYGRIVRAAEGDVLAIVEAADATPEQLAIGEVNSSIYMFSSEALWPALERLQPSNAQGELYLTDVVRDLVEGGQRVGAHLAGNPAEVEGVNTQSELAAASAALRQRINEVHMLSGVTIVDPLTTWIDVSVQLEPGCTVHPFTVLKGTARVAEGASVGPHAVVDSAVIGAEASVGPFCYVRPETVLEAKAKAGTFVELKNTRVGEDARVPHLSYMGDAEIGAGTNIGAGSITANLPPHAGAEKQHTVIGRDVKVSVDTMFVPPVTIGDEAWTAAGSVITEDVPPKALAIARARQVIKEGRGGKRND